MHASVRKLGVVLSAAVLTLLVTEGVVRFAAPAYNPSGRVAFIGRLDGTAVGPRNVTRRMVKNTGDYDVEVRFNELGLRESKPLRTSTLTSTSTSTSGSIFVVGDSFAFGWGVEERQRFSNLLQERLGLPVFNVSAASADLEGYDRLVRSAEENGATIGTLVVTVCMENDLSVYESSTAPSTFEPLGAVKAYLADHSAAYFLATVLIHRTPWLERGAARLGLLVPNLAGIAPSDNSEAAALSSARRLVRLIAGRRAIVLIVPSRALWAGVEDERRRAAHAMTRSSARSVRTDSTSSTCASRSRQGAIHSRFISRTTATGIPTGIASRPARLNSDSGIPNSELEVLRRRERAGLEATAKHRGAESRSGLTAATNRSTLD